MTFAEFRSDTVPVQLPNNALIKVEVAQTGREDVAFNVKSFQGVTDAIEGVAEAISSSLEKVSPNKASVKFGLEVEIEQGSLVAAIVRGTGKANLEVTLEWEKPTPPPLHLPPLDSKVRLSRYLVKPVPEVPESVTPSDR